ncbi:MAG: hypothetical protein ACREP9_11385, partial [Candidatus Dormibacteraceae bacterium]
VLEGPPGEHPLDLEGERASGATNGLYEAQEPVVRPHWEIEGLRLVGANLLWPKRKPNEGPELRIAFKAERRFEDLHLDGLRSVPADRQLKSERVGVVAEAG